MRRRVWIMLVPVLATLARTAPCVGTQDPTSPPAEILVRFARPLPAQSLAKSTSGRTDIAALDAVSAQLRIVSVTPLFNRRRAVERSTDADLLRSVAVVGLGPAVDADAAAAALAAQPGVLYAEPNRRLRLDSVPNDPGYEYQWWLRTIRAPEAWDVTSGSSDIVVGVIDTGVDYEHEDLHESLWVNTPEDLNGNGRLDPDDLNGVDDDGNGFVDDVIGWDFTDAPGFADGGDFLDPDPDPADENGHGTSVTGIIAAATNNGIGVAGLASDCRVMTLRAGTSRGFLQEDDVAQALVYAVENGARVINMSFGDTVVSPLLRDMIRFAYRHNIVLVASAGNSGNEELHYPSGFDEVIAVGSTDSNDELASFSNRGSWVDLVAPGMSVWTTAPGDGYRNFSGTSASAPVVSGLAGLVLSLHPAFTPEAIKGILLTTAVDLGELGWDRLFAGGRIDAVRALHVPHATVARITEPVMDSGVGGTQVVIHGTAAGSLFASYDLGYGVGAEPDSFVVFAEGRGRQVVEDSLGVWDVFSLPDTTYTLRLRVDQFGTTPMEDRARVFLDRTAPRISSPVLTPMIDGDGHSVLVEFETDDVCDAIIYWRERQSSDHFHELPLNYRSSGHRLNIDQSVTSGSIEFYVEAVNRTGLVSREDNDGHLYMADLSLPPVSRTAFSGVPGSLPSGYLLGRAADFDADGKPEILMNEYGPNFSFQGLKIFEREGEAFQEVWDSGGLFIPRDWGDSDGDGRAEILAGAGRASFVFEAQGEFQFPTQLVWMDTNEVWAGRFADADGDGRGEILARIGVEWGVWESSGDNQYARVASLPNPTEGLNLTGVPHAEVGDFDGDGHQEILLGDLDGDIYLYENRGDNSYAATWSDRLPLVDTIDFISCGDYDGDGTEEFLAGSHSDPELDSEHEFDSRHWLFRIYKADADDSYTVVWQQAFFGFQPPHDFDSGVSSGDMDGDGRDEALLNIFPDFYVVDYVPATGYEVVWHSAPDRSNTTVVEDLDGDGGNEVWFNDGGRVVGFELLSPGTRPPTPLGFEARPLGPDDVALLWRDPGAQSAFRIYRGESPDQLAVLAQTATPQFHDTTVVAGIRYWYRVSALDPARIPSESLLSRLASARPGERPFLTEGVFVAPNTIRLNFSELMGPPAKTPTNYDIVGVGHPTSAVPSRSGRDILLTTPMELLAPGDYVVVASGVEDVDRTPIDTTRNRVEVQVAMVGTTPYIVRATLVAPAVVEVEFSEAMESESVSTVGNYEFTPAVRIVSVEIADDPGVVRLLLDPESRIGRSGKNYTLSVHGVANVRGVPLRPGEGDAVGLLFAELPEPGVRVYPNPWRSSGGAEAVTFMGVARNSQIHVYSVSGEKVASLTMRTNEGRLAFDLRDSNGRPLPAGIYIYEVITGEGARFGKFAIVR